ncbi:anthranilate synthase component 1 [Thalassotalea maritima]|uniref:anthranilate synthase component 1 n=1 Tax=Thalassotalea maritima TaxID=3242416 RepID=UPI00352960C6
MTAQQNNTDITPSLKVVTSTLTAPYQSDPLSLYRHLSRDKAHSLLLESAEVDNKRALKSIILAQANLKVRCDANLVTVTPLNSSGWAVIEHIIQQLKHHSQAQLLTVSKHADKLVVSFNATLHATDEMSRLLSVTPLEVLRCLQNIVGETHPFSVFLGGCFAFDLISISEQLPDVDDGDNTCPDFVFYLAESLIVIDHKQQSTQLVHNRFYTSAEHDERNALNGKIALATLQYECEKSHQSIDIDLKTRRQSGVKEDVSDQQFCQHVSTLQEHIRAGDIFQVVPSRSFNLPCHDPLLAYQALKQTNPSPYMFFLKDADFQLFGASPESALKFASTTRQVELYPIAGTRPRGFTRQGTYSADLDGRIELELRNDEKEKAEHLMLVDLARNDIARVSIGGSRHVAELLNVDRYSHVMHLVSRVLGTLQPQLDALHAYQACMNMGTLSGAPKVKATELIRQIEGKRRGSYGGAVGYLTGDGDMDTCIVIRSAFVKDQQAIIQAGAGVVHDSIPQAEADETRQKAQAVITAIEIANANFNGELAADKHRHADIETQPASIKEPSACQ